MKLITPNNILLPQNIISIYIDIEEFIEAVDDSVSTGLVDIDDKERAELNNYLCLQAGNPGSVFIGVFYSAHPVDYTLEVCWTLLKNNKDYQIFLTALAEDSVFDLSNGMALIDDDNITVLDSPYINEYSPDEEDEYDLELDLDDTFLDDDDD